MAVSESEEARQTIYACTMNACSKPPLTPWNDDPPEKWYQKWYQKGSQWRSSQVVWLGHIWSHMKARSHLKSVVRVNEKGDVRIRRGGSRGERYAEGQSWFEKGKWNVKWYEKWYERVKVLEEVIWEGVEVIWEKGRIDILSDIRSDMRRGRKWYWREGEREGAEVI